jgi:type IV secretory pathway VirB4 component
MPEPTLATQQFVDIREIRDSVVYLKNGGLRKILMVSGVNFDLKSEDEQSIILNTFQNFLNGLDFPIQFFIHSRKVNVEKYLSSMEERGLAEKNQLLKIQIDEYINFIRSFVEKNAIISKSFFVVVPYDPANATKDAQGFLSFLGLGGKGNKATQQAGEKQDLEQLGHRIREVESGLEQIGLRVAELQNEELLELFYNLYNPQLTEKKDLKIFKKV